MQSLKFAFDSKQTARRFLRVWPGKNINLYENTVTITKLKDEQDIEVARIQAQFQANKLEIKVTEL